MPFITVDYAAGTALDRHKDLQEKLICAVVDAFGAPRPSVRVFLRSFNPDDVYAGDGNHETCLPVVRAEFLSGRTNDQKRTLLVTLARTTAEALEVPVDQVRTILFEKDRWDWARGDSPVAERPQ